MNTQLQRLSKILLLLAIGSLTMISASGATLLAHSVVYAYTRGQYKKSLSYLPTQEQTGGCSLPFHFRGGGTNDLYMTDVNNITI
jgi:hypothetical protein